jgi:hypothetical protein
MEDEDTGPRSKRPQNHRVQAAAAAAAAAVPKEEKNAAPSRLFHENADQIERDQALLRARYQRGGISTAGGVENLLDVKTARRSDLMRVFEPSRAQPNGRIPTADEARQDEVNRPKHCVMCDKVIPLPNVVRSVAHCYDCPAAKGATVYMCSMACLRVHSQREKH